MPAMLVYGLMNTYPYVKHTFRCIIDTRNLLFRPEDVSSNFERQFCLSNELILLEFGGAVGKRVELYFMVHNIGTFGTAVCFTTVQVSACCFRHRPVVRQLKIATPSKRSGFIPGTPMHAEVFTTVSSYFGGFGFDSMKPTAHTVLLKPPALCSAPTEPCPHLTRRDLSGHIYRQQHRASGPKT